MSSDYEGLIDASAAKLRWQLKEWAITNRKTLAEPSRDPRERRQLAAAIQDLKKYLKDELEQIILPTQLELAKKMALSAPISMLPAEILLQIFMRVCQDRDSRCEPLYNVLLVCHNWYHICLSSPKPWSNITVELHTPLRSWYTGHPCLLAGRIDCLAERAKNCLIDLTLTCESPATLQCTCTCGGVIANLFKRIKSSSVPSLKFIKETFRINQSAVVTLENLEWLYIGNLDQYSRRPQMAGSMIHLPRLAVLEVTNIRALPSLDCPALKRLTVSWRHDSIDDPLLSHFIGTLPTLEQLDISHRAVDYRNDRPSPKFPSNAFPQLRTLKASYADRGWWCDYIANPILSSSPGIRSIEIVMSDAIGIFPPTTTIDHVKELTFIIETGMTSKREPKSDRMKRALRTIMWFEAFPNVTKLRIRAQPLLESRRRPYTVTTAFVNTLLLEDLENSQSGSLGTREQYFPQLEELHIVDVLPREDVLRQFMSRYSLELVDDITPIYTSLETLTYRHLTLKKSDPAAKYKDKYPGSAKLERAL